MDNTDHLWIERPFAMRQPIIPKVHLISARFRRTCMSRALWFCLTLWLSTFALTQEITQHTPSVPSPSSTGVEVVYVVDGTNILTYDVDPNTLNATQVGQSLKLADPTFSQMVTSPDDHFLYITTYDRNQGENLWVYTTDASGVPQTPAVQKLKATGLYGIQIQPHTNFAYLMFGSTDTQGNNVDNVVRYVVSSTNGKLSSPVIVATYTGPNYCGAFLIGSNASGTKLYDDFGCSPHDSNQATFYERTVNFQTGALGADVQIFSWNEGGTGFDNVSLVGNLLIDFKTPNNFQQGINSVNVYPLVPNTTKTLIQCTAKMLEACGYAFYDLVHPSGKYLFLQIAQDVSQIARIELSTKKIVDTGNYIPYSVRELSPDGSLAYAITAGTAYYFVEIYGFNAANGEVTPGGSIFVPSSLDPFYSAERF
jgi:hypothetical protein